MRRCRDKPPFRSKAQCAYHYTAATLRGGKEERGASHAAWENIGVVLFHDRGNRLLFTNMKATVAKARKALVALEPAVVPLSIFDGKWKILANSSSPGGGGGAISYSGLYGKAPSERGILKDSENRHFSI